MKEYFVEIIIFIFLIAIPVNVSRNQGSYEAHSEQAKLEWTKDQIDQCYRNIDNIEARILITEKEIKNKLDEDN